MNTDYFPGNGNRLVLHIWRSALSDVQTQSKAARRWILRAKSFQIPTTFVSHWLSLAVTEPTFQVIYINTGLTVLQHIQTLPYEFFHRRA